MLEHADGDNAVEAIVQIAIILKTNLYVKAIAARLGHLLLFGGDGHADNAHLVISRHIFGKTAPAAADIQHSHAWLELQLTADEIQLILLRGFEGLRLFPVTAGILHVGIQHPAEKIVAEVIVLFADNPGAFFTLQVKQASACDAECVFEMMRELFFQPGAEHFMEEYIQTLAVPPAVHIAFA